MRFRGVLAIEGQETVDGRLIEHGALIWPTTEPIPLHLGFGGPVVGSVESLERVGGAIVCEIETNQPAGSSFGLAVGIEVDSGAFESERLYRVRSGRITHAAVTDEPAFPEARAELIDDQTEATAAAEGTDVARLVMACGYLLVARTSLYDQQRGHSLIPVIDRKLRRLLDEIPG